MKRRVAVIFGGRSAEHEISCISARSVAEALDPNRFEVVAIGVDRQGRWRLLPEVPALPEAPRALPSVETDSGEAISLPNEPGGLLLASGAATAVDVVFPLVHGPYGEDGTIQGLLEMAGLPYVGAGVLGSAVGMDKAVQKVLLAAAGLPVVPHAVVYERDWREDPDQAAADAEALGYPVFVKPANLGSSVGITKVHKPEALDDAVEEALRFDTKALLEQSFEEAREIECAILGNDDPVASVPGEIVPSSEFYDYSAKYLDGASELRIPAPIPADDTEEIQQMAVKAFRAIDAAGMARVDFFYRETGDEPRIVVNELNTIPGFTSISMYPKLWEASGLPYPRLLERLIDLAIERHEREAKKSSRQPGA